jgi:hypothetical protein
MTIRYKCAECGAAMNINEELAGTEGNCPRCQVQFTVPAPDSDAATNSHTAPQPAVEVRQRASTHSEEGPLSDDDIDAFLSSDPSSSVGRRDSSADSDDELQTDKNPFDEHAGEPPEEADEAQEKRSNKKKGKRAGAATAKPDSAKSASIAQSLMGRGATPVESDRVDETVRKKRKPFGGREEKHAGEISSFKEMVAYFAKLGWPFVAGGGAFLALCFYLSFSMMKHFEAPPLAPVSGTVTLDGKPLKLAIVKFMPVTEGAAGNEGFKRGATSFGFTDADGKYTLTYANADGKPVLGALIGKHQVQIQLSDPAGAQLIPARYSTFQSELMVDVAKGKGPTDFPLKSDPVEKTE